MKQAEVLSENMRRNIPYGRSRTTLCTVNPQYNSGHDKDMSADDLLHHPVESQIGSGTKLCADSDTQAIPGGSHRTTSTSAQHDVYNAGERSDNRISTEDLGTLQSMLDRLDEMQKEHVEIRHRWVAAYTKYDDVGLISLDDGAVGDEAETGNAIFEAPRPLMLKKSQSHGAKATKSTPNTQASVESRYLPKNKSTTNLTQDNDTGYRERVISLPEAKIKSIEKGKEQYEKHLNNNGHTQSAGFDPWEFAKQTADEVMESCIAQVSNELVDVGDGIVQKIYADEFVAAKHHPEGDSDFQSPQT